MGSLVAVGMVLLSVLPTVVELMMNRRAARVAGGV